MGERSRHCFALRAADRVPAWRADAGSGRPSCHDRRQAAQTANELLAAAAGAEEGFRAGIVSVVQTFGDRANFHPHVHALVTRGGWTGSGEWVPVPYVDERAAEELFRHKVLGLLRRRGPLSQDRIELLLSWKRSGFSVHNRVYAHPGDGRDFEALVRYMMRSPVSLTRLRFTPGAKEVVYARKGPDPRRPGGPAGRSRLGPNELPGGGPGPRGRAQSHPVAGHAGNERALHRVGGHPGDGRRRVSQGRLGCPGGRALSPAGMEGPRHRGATDRDARGSFPATNTIASQPPKSKGNLP
jgi:hypothetical protein